VERWVVVNGIPAAQQGGEGRVIFINGFVLSYPRWYYDVTVNVTVDGAVPRATGPNITVLRIMDLDSSARILECTSP